VALKLNNNML
jgi:hypothetical protein